MALNITANDFNVISQSYINQYVRLNVLDFAFNMVDEISGRVSNWSVNCDANSDLRRSFSVQMEIDDSSFEVQPGSQIWIDKYVQPYIGYENIFTGEIQWYNQGIYLINAPSWQYDAESNSLGFSGLDLMSKLTGLRNGQLEGIPTVISQGENVRSAIIDTLALGGFTNYIVDECTLEDGTIQPVPNDIEITQGGTVYDVLSELRDILPQYQIYFDVNGVFHYNKIPSGKDAPVLIDDTIWSKILIGENIATDFESVKNYIEVYGRTHEIKYYGDSSKITFNPNNGYIEMDIASLAEVTSLYEYMTVGFTLPIDVSFGTGLVIHMYARNEQGQLLADFPAYLLHNPKDGSSVTSLLKDTYWVITFTGTAWNFSGHLQPTGIAYDNNPESPFYINGPTGKIRIVLSGGEYDNISSDYLAQERANIELYWRDRVNDSISLSCVPIPWLDVDIVISHATKGGDTPELYIVKSFSMSTGESNSMNINAIRYYPYYPTY